MIPARMPCFCIDVSGLFVRLGEQGPRLLWIFTIFCAFVATGLLLCGGLSVLLHSAAVRRAADFIQGTKRKRGTMKPIDLLFIVSLISMVVIDCVVVLVAIFAPKDMTADTAILLTGLLLGFGAFTLFYCRVRLLPIAYPGLFRKDRDE